MSTTDLDSILERAASIAGVSKDSELADVLGVTRQTLSKWRQRETVPYEKLVEFVGKQNCTLDYLIFGTASETKLSQIDVKLISWIYTRFIDANNTVKYHFPFEANPPAHVAAIYNFIAGSDVAKEVPEHYLTENFKRILDGVISVYAEHENEASVKEKAAIQEFKKLMKRDQSQEASSTKVKQSFHAEVGQVAGRDINNKE